MNSSSDQESMEIHSNQEQMLQFLYKKVEEQSQEIEKLKSRYDTIIRENRDECIRLRQENEYLRNEVERLKKPQKSGCCCLQLFQTMFSGRERDTLEQGNEIYYPAAVQSRQ